MELRKKQLIDLYLGGILLVVLRPFIMLLGWMLHRDHHLQLNGPVAFVKLHGGGSLLIAMPALQGLRDAHPELEFSLVCTPATAQFGQLTGVFDRLILIDDRSWSRMLLTGFKALLACRNLDTIIDFEVHSRLSTVFCALTMARNRIVFYTHAAYWRKKISTHLVYFNHYAGSHLFYQQICRLLGAEPATPERCRQRFLDNLPPIDNHEPAMPDPTSTRIGLGCFCSGLARERLLTPQQWSELLRPACADRPTTLILFGGARERQESELFGAILAAELPTVRIVNHCGSGSLARSVALIARLDGFWSIDSGLLHAARLLRIPTVSFWGPTMPSMRLEPVAGLVETVHYHQVFCSPCVHVAEQPPCNGNNICMQRLTRITPVDHSSHGWAIPA